MLLLVGSYALNHADGMQTAVIYSYMMLISGYVHVMYTYMMLILPDLLERYMRNQQEAGETDSELVQGVWVSIVCLRVVKCGPS